MQKDPPHHEVEDLLDALVAEFSDQLSAGHAPAVPEFLRRAPKDARPGLERCLKTLLSSRTPGPLQLVRPGSRLGRYTVEREIGRGGMALVFLARDGELGRAVALKVLRPGLALEANHRDRFRREGQAMARLNHPNVVAVFEVGEQDGLDYLAMEYVPGPSLESVRQALPTERLPSAEELAAALGAPALARTHGEFEPLMAHLFGELCAGLVAAHEVGLIHRDIKPANILIHSGGRPVLADFGLAQADGDSALSLSGTTLGTPHYMSPEQAHLVSAAIDGRTDIYSLGATFYELLGGQRPYEGDSVFEVFQAIRARPPAPLRQVNKGLSPDSEAVCQRAMQHDPELRYGSASELESDLVALAERRPTNALSEGASLTSQWKSARRAMSAGRGFQIRSTRTCFGWPLLHIVSGRRQPGLPRVARGWLAIGPLAVGGIAIGSLGVGLVGLGGVGLGGLALGGLAAGLYSVGGLATGGLASGGLAVGYQAVGGMAVGHTALGGMAVGRYAFGGKARGTHVISREEGLYDPQAIEHFRSISGSWRTLGTSRLWGPVWEILDAHEPSDPR